MYIKDLIKMRREERALLHNRMEEVAKQDLNTSVWAGTDPYRGLAELYRSSADLHTAVALAVGLYCCVGLAVKIAELLRR